MDDILKRLGNVEASVAEVKIQVGAILAFVPHLATAASVSAISAVIPHLATKADVLSMETTIIKWIIATVLTSVGVAFAIAKFVH